MLPETKKKLAIGFLIVSIVIVIIGLILVIVIDGWNYLGWAMALVGVVSIVGSIASIPE
jgi:hypothetical protein